MFRAKKKGSGVSESLRRISHNFYHDAFEIIVAGMTNTVLEAKATHRFCPQTGNLERSILSDVKRCGKEIVGKVYLEDSIAVYGKYIHRGFKSWTPDPFLETAKDKYFPQIKSAIEAKLKQLVG